MIANGTTTNPKSTFRRFLLLCAWAILVGSSSHAATMSANSAAPVIDIEDIANYGGVSSTDKWFTGSDGAARGQSCTTGGAALRLKAIFCQHSWVDRTDPKQGHSRFGDP